MFYWLGYCLKMFKVCLQLNDFKSLTFSIKFFSCTFSVLKIIRNEEVDYFSPKKFNDFSLFKSERVKKRNQLTTSPSRPIKPPTLKYYLKNVTVNRGDFVQLDCPANKIANESDFVSAESNKIHIREIHFDESILIKTVIFSFFF